MSEVCSDQAASTHVFFHGSDSTDSDFIQSHVDSFFPPANSSKEVIEENLEENIGEEEGDDDGIPDDVPDEIGDVIEELEFSDMEEGEYASGPVVSVISGEVDADDAEIILDLLLYSDEDMENRVANYNDLDTTQTVGLATDLIRLIPWTGFEMDETGELPKEITYSDVIGGIIVDLIGGFTEFVTTVVGTLHEGVLALAGFIADMGEIVVEWGMRVIDAISEAFSAVRDAVSEVGELMSALGQWIEDKVSGLFSSVWERVISGLESWAEGIQEAMEGFFEELAEWDEMDGSESMEDTMEAGSALMLSFIGLQDKASPLMDVMERVMRFIEPFQEYISPFGAIGIISNVVGATVNGGGGIFDALTDLGALGIEYVWETITGSSLLEGILEEEIDLGTTIPSITAVKNFLGEADLPDLPIVSLVIGFLPEEGEVSETISVEMALLLGVGMGIYGAHFSPEMASLSIFTNLVSWIFNLLSWVVEGAWGIFYGGLGFTTGAISLLSGILAKTIKGPQAVAFVASPMIGVFLALSQME